MAVIVKVYLLAFFDVADVRDVTIPDLPADAPLALVLEETFRFGQNDFQPLPKPSVSVGDVAEVGGQHYLVCGCGFRRLTQAELDAYKAMPRRDRTAWAMSQTANI